MDDIASDDRKVRIRLIGNAKAVAPPVWVLRAFVSTHHPYGFERVPLRVPVNFAPELIEVFRGALDLQPP